ncbi:MAG: hypothetical protein J5877_01150 [Clostridia bacterium]|nr:hypothetical protein [Clostridia bacterium]
MRCEYCQSDFDDNLMNCPVCGAPVPPPEDKKPDYFSQANESYPQAGAPYAQNGFIPAAPMINPLHAKTDMLVKDSLFLATCILNTVATALPLFGDFKGFNVIGVIVTIFLWLIYADGKKNILPNPARIRIISGCIYATKVILYVVSGLLALMGLLCFFSASSWIKYFTDAFNPGTVPADDFERLFSMGGWAIGIGFIFVAGFMAVLNYFSYGKIHKFVKSCYENIQTGVNALENRNITSVWLIVFTVIMGISAVANITNSPVSAVSLGCQAATCVTSYLLIKKYYIEYN